MPEAMLTCHRFVSKLVFTRFIVQSSKCSRYVVCVAVLGANLAEHVCRLIKPAADIEATLRINCFVDYKLIQDQRPYASHARCWHIFTGLTGAEMSQLSGVLQTFSIKESVVRATSEVLGLGSKRGIFDPQRSSSCSAAKGARAFTASSPVPRMENHLSASFSGLCRRALGNASLICNCIHSYGTNVICIEQFSCRAENALSSFLRSAAH